jgi:hypothetical protein
MVCKSNHYVTSAFSRRAGRLRPIGRSNGRQAGRSASRPIGWMINRSAGQSAGVDRFDDRLADRSSDSPALAFNSTFVEELLQKKVNNYYDMWLLNELSFKRREWNAKKFPPASLATVCIPSIFEHIPDMDKRFRGSGRLSAIASNAAEEDAYYICLDLSGNWGLCNRLQTIVLMLQFCSWHRLGIYILWTKNEACPGLFDELFDIDFQAPSLNSVPFIKVFDNASNSSWKASVQNKNWSVGYMSAQSNVQDGLKTIMEQYNIIKKKKTRSATT